MALGGTRMKEKKDPATLEAFFSLSFFYFFLVCNPRFPFAYKRGSRAPLLGGIKKTQKHDTSTWLSSNRALSTYSLLPPETWDPFTLSPVCKPSCKPSAGNTSNSELDVGTFRPNQYKPLCPSSTPSDPDVQIQIYSSVVQKHRHTDNWCAR